MATPEFRQKLFCDSMEHHWVVWGIIKRQRTLVCGCRNCFAMGVVTDPSIFEWEKAIREPLIPYTWHFHNRVEIVTCRLPAVPQNRDADRF